MRARSLATLLSLALLACGPDGRDGADDPGADDDPPGTPDGGDGFVDAAPLPDGGGPSGDDAVVYIHSSSTLYRVDPDTLVITKIGPFGWPSTILTDSMTDIAVDQAGAITGVSFDRVYAVNAQTAACTFLADIQGGVQFNALSWIPAGGVDSSDQEILVGAATDGSFWRVDPLTGATSPIGNYAGGITSSGDIVSVKGAGTFATVKHGGAEKLAKLNPQSGAATPIGPTGVSNIWGLGYWKGKVFGFTSLNQFVIIDPQTGDATLAQTTEDYWWGAGVTTLAPIVD